jgi:virginiamycin B lyase
MLQVGPMPKLFLTIALASIVAGAMSLAAPDLRAQASDSIALSGVVSSQQEGLMEGVVVSARRDGANFTVSVVSDAHGKYSFPRLMPGKYVLTIRAVGYDLNGPAAVEVAEGKTSNADLKLEKTKDLAAQLSSLEWAMSVPGTPEQKDTLVYQTVSCAYCHALERANTHGGALHLCRMAPKFKEMLRMTKMDTVFLVYDTEAEAVHSFTK